MFNYIVILDNLIGAKKKKIELLHIGNINIYLMLVYIARLYSYIKLLSDSNDFIRLFF